MDRLDRIAALALVVLLSATAFLVHQDWADGPTPDRPALLAAEGTIKPVASPELAARIRTVKELLAAGSLEGAEPLIQDLVREFPYAGDPHMAMADLLMRKQEPVEAMAAFRQAIERNPDFLDRKAPQFEGKKIKACLEEAKVKIMDGLRKDPASPALKEHRKILYYMQRRLAGSCG